MEIETSQPPARAKRERYTIDEEEFDEDDAPVKRLGVSAVVKPIDPLLSATAFTLLREWVLDGFDILCVSAFAALIRRHSDGAWGLFGLHQGRFYDLRSSQHPLLRSIKHGALLKNYTFAERTQVLALITITSSMTSTFSTSSSSTYTTSSTSTPSSTWTTTSTSTFTTMSTSTPTTTSSTTASTTGSSSDTSTVTTTIVTATLTTTLTTTSTSTFTTTPRTKAPIYIYQSNGSSAVLSSTLISIVVSIASVAILVGMFVMYYRRRRPLPATEVLVREHGSEVNYDFAMNNTTSGTEYTELDILADVSMDVWDDDEEKVLSLSTQKYLTVE